MNRVLATGVALTTATLCLVLAHRSPELRAQAAASPSPRTPPAAQTPAPPGSTVSDADRTLLTRYCFTCHDSRLKTAGLALDALDLAAIAHDAPTWEKVVSKLRGGMMPPVGRPRPDAKALDEFTAHIESDLNRAAAASPEPGRVPHHRLNRAEYTNAVRDLLGVEV